VATGIVLWYCRRLEQRARPRGSPATTGVV
jgi:hypothetical protein